MLLWVVKSVDFEEGNDNTKLCHCEARSNRELF
jgi:hypothetical protein